ncbi:hypothetical protein EDD22DRAFT_541835 [Suillus occidentalis]|nr:hypothetical protein EDD22DRAFT_541835 [Suillus occidentalis]
MTHSNRRHLKASQKYSASPAPRSATSHFWRYATRFQASPPTITATFQADATRYYDEFGGVNELPPRFFHSTEVDDGSSQTGGAHPLFVRLASLFRSFRPDNAGANELSQIPTPSGLCPHVLFARLSSLIHRFPPDNDAPNELQQPSTPSRLNIHATLAHRSSILPRSLPNTEDTESHIVTPSRSRPDAVMDLPSSLFHSQHRTNELSQRATRLHVVDVAPMRDREVLFVAERAQARPHYQSSGTPHSRPIRLLGHIGLFLCCVCNHQHIDGHTQPTQQPQGQSQGQAPSSQTQPAAPSASATSGALGSHTTVPGAST